MPRRHNHPPYKKGFFFEDRKAGTGFGVKASFSRYRNSTGCVEAPVTHWLRGANAYPNGASRARLQAALGVSLASHSAPAGHRWPKFWWCSPSKNREKKKIRLLFVLSCCTQTLPPFEKNFHNKSIMNASNNRCAWGQDNNGKIGT